MTVWLTRIVANACGLAAAAFLFGGISVTGASTTERVIILVVVALIFGVVNEFVRPVVAFLSFPLYLLTLGLMFFIVNALMLLLTGWLADQLNVGFHVTGFWTAVFGSIVVSLVSWLAGLVLPGPQ
ncbi:MAG: phage holin family protein [Propionibacteriales bacterium]|nr:phage holin family protein [Propionibacteriales bacterium]